MKSVKFEKLQYKMVDLVVSDKKIKSTNSQNLVVISSCAKQACTDLPRYLQNAIITTTNYDVVDVIQVDTSSYEYLYRYRYG